MEISRIINNLEDFNQVSSDNDLDLIIEDLSKFSFEDFIYIEYVGNSENLDVRELLRKLINKIDDAFKGNSIEKKVDIIKSLVSIFQKGLNEINLSYVFIFLHANSRIDLPIGELVNKQYLNKEFNEILIKIFEILNNIKIHVADEALSMYFDKLNALNWEETLITSLKEIDFEKYNPLIRNNKFILPIHFYQMIYVLKEYNLELFEKLLTSDNVFSLVLIIMCIRLYQLNKTLFNGLMDIFMYNEFFNEVMGAMFCKLSKGDFNILIDSIPLNDNVEWIDVRTKMLNECSECENSEYIFELIYKKWENYLLNSFNEKNKALNILCTDFCNFIIAYYFHKYDDDKLLDSMKELFVKLKNLDSEWSYNIIHHRNKFFVYYSKLFIFSVIYEFNKLNDDEIKVYYNEFYEEYVLFKKFLDNKKEHFLDRFEENLLDK